MPTSGDQGSPAPRASAKGQGPRAKAKDSAVPRQEAPAEKRKTEDAVAAAGEGDEEADEPDSQGSVTPPYTLGQEKFDNGFRDLSPRTIREIIRRNVERWRAMETGNAPAALATGRVGAPSRGGAATAALAALAHAAPAALADGGVGTPSSGSGA